MQRYGLCTLFLVIGLAFGCRPRVGSVSALQQEGGQSRLPRAGKQFLKQPVPGRYVGFSKAIATEKGNFLPTTADLVLYGIDGSLLRYVAVVRLSLGTHVSDEYLSFYTDKIYFNNDTGKLEAPKVEEGPYTLNFDGLAEEYIAFSIWRGSNRMALGRLKLFQGTEAPVVEAKNVLPPLTGQYQGECNGQEKFLQLEHLRTNQTKGTSPFPGFLISGRIGAYGPDCPAGKPKCVERVFSHVAYNPFSGVIALQSRDRPMTCHQTPTKLKCGTCEFTRSDQIAGASSKLAFPRKKSNVKGVQFGEKHSFDNLGRPGVYHGTLHHEGYDHYQPFQLTVDEHGKRGVAEVSFANNLRSIFELQKESEHRPSGLLVFDGVGNGFLQVQRATASTLVGVWFSKTYGRVGTVELTRTETQQRDPQPSLLTGLFSGAQWQYHLVGRSGVSSHPKDDFPIVLTGWFQEVANPGQKRRIQSAYVDPYGFSLSFRTDDGRSIRGSISSDGHQLLWSNESMVGSALGDLDMALYQRAVGQPVVH